MGRLLLMKYTDSIYRKGDNSLSHKTRTTDNNNFWPIKIPPGRKEECEDQERRTKERKG